ncbi:hypothetical protein ACIRQH_37905 [Streptomyces sp. NPDC102279]|uniref:hypothetical protein n=1 Tax=Streptomyces sp. NPDC102279 TaxID=3366153 RepID=UPI00381C9230
MLERDGSARWKRWATGYSVDESRITGRDDGRGTWTLETVQGKQYFDVQQGNASEQVTLLQDEAGLILLQIPGEDPDNSIGCRFKRADGQKPN